MVVLTRVHPLHGQCLPVEDDEGTEGTAAHGGRRQPEAPSCVCSCHYTSGQAEVGGVQLGLAWTCRASVEFVNRTSLVTGSTIEILACITTLFLFIYEKRYEHLF